MRGRVVRRRVMGGRVVRVDVCVRVGRWKMLSVDTEWLEQRRYYGNCLEHFYRWSEARELWRRDWWVTVDIAEREGSEAREK